jgi:CheY-like chemotaxis protein
LAAIFESQKDIKVIGEATNGEEASELYNQHAPDVLLLDLKLAESMAHPEPSERERQVLQYMANGRGSYALLNLVAAWPRRENFLR